MYMLRPLLFILGIFFVLTITSVEAQDSSRTPNLYDRNATPLDINSIPVLSALVKNGAKLYYLGERSGLYGWFIVKDGQVQMIYVTADGKTAIIGGMFTGDGENVTGPQIQELATVNREIGELVSIAAKQQEDVIKTGATPGGFAAIPGNTATDSGKQAGNVSLSAVPSVPLSPGERLFQDLQAAAGVTLGKNPNAEVLLVMGPNCPHCKTTWKELRKHVEEGRVQVRLIPVINKIDGIDVGKSEDVRLGAQLLKASDPFNVWNKYVDGDKSVLAGEADSVQAQAVLSNAMLVEKWNIRTTPYMVYRSKDGRIKIVQGEPQRMAAIISDLPR